MFGKLLQKIWMPVLFVLVGIALFWLVNGNLFSQADRETLPPEEQRLGNPDAVAVTVAPVAFRPIQRSVVVVGTLFGYEEVAISSKVEGRVKKIHHDVSARVKPGEVVIEIDPTDAELAVQQAERVLHIELAKLGLKQPPTRAFDITTVPAVRQAKARLDKDERQYTRAKKLFDDQALAQEVLDNAHADFRAADAEYANQLIQAGVVLESIKAKQIAFAIVQQQLRDTFIRLPTPTLPVPDADGQLTYAISHRSVAEGSFVRVGGEVCKAVIDRPLKLRVLVPEQHGSEVKLGQKVEITSAAFKEPFAGTVARINPAIDASNRTVEVEIRVPNADAKLKPGGFARAAILTRLDPNAATVPLEALVQFAGVTKIFLIDGDRVKEARVKLGVESTDFVEVLEPALPSGSQVVISGQVNLAEGMPITVRKK